MVVTWWFFQYHSLSWLLAVVTHGLLLEDILAVLEPKNGKGQMETVFNELISSVTQRVFRSVCSNLAEHAKMSNLSYNILCMKNNIPNDKWIKNWYVPRLKWSFSFKEIPMFLRNDWEIPNPSKYNITNLCLEAPTFSDKELLCFCREKINAAFLWWARISWPLARNMATIKPLKMKGQQACQIQ